MLKKWIIVSSLIILLFPALSLAHYEISDGSVMALYHLNNDVIDSSGNGKNGYGNTATFATSTNAKLGGYSAYYNGSTKTQLDVLSTAGNSSVCLWTKYTSTGGYMYMSYNSSGYAYQTIYDNGAGKIYASARGANVGGTSDPLSTGTLNDGNYHFICTRWDSTTGKQELWIDGSYNAIGGAGSTGSSYSSINSSHLGCYGTGCTSKLTGYVDEVIVFNTKISTSTITSLYNSGNGVEVCTTAGCGTIEEGCASSTIQICDASSTDIFKIYYTSTSTTTGSTTLTSGTYSIPFFLYLFVLSLTCVPFLILPYFYYRKVKEKHV